MTTLINQKVTPINDRDVWLQSYANRFTSASVQTSTPTNVVQLQTVGDSLTAGAKLTLTSTSQAFTYT